MTRAARRPSRSRRLLAGAGLSSTIAIAALACGGAIESTDSPAARFDDPPRTDASASSLPADASRDVTRDPSDADADMTPIGPAPDGSLADGVCTHPTGHKSLFDPDCVYVLGTFLEGAGGREVLFEPGHPDDHRGMVPDGLFAVVRPADNRLLHGANVVRVFEADTFGGIGYPLPPTAYVNDPVIATPACPTAATLRGVFPDDSVSVYSCRFASWHLEGSTAPLVGLEKGFDALGPMRTALVIRPANGPKIWSNGVDVPLTGWPSGVTVVAARHGGASNFLVAVSAGSVLQQWSVAFTGVATLVGDYLNPLALQTTFMAALDPAGNLYRRVSSANDAIFRFSLTTAPALVYEEVGADGKKKLIRLHSAMLITGP